MRPAILTIILLLFINCSGCERATPETKLNSERQALRLRLQGLQSNYIIGDTSQARQSLQSAIQLLKNQKCLDEDDMASALLLEYARLAVLEREAHNEVLADAYLLKARFWHLTSLEAHRPTEEAMKIVNSYDQAKYKEVVSEFDKTPKSILVKQK